MKSKQEQSEEYVTEFLSGLPTGMGFKLYLTDSGLFELRSKSCIIRFGFNQYEPRDCELLELENPADPSQTLTVWLLILVREVPNNLSKSSSVADLAGELARYFEDILLGDFSIKEKYDELKDWIMDQMSNIYKLPADHPTKVKFENRNLEWLFDMEKAGV